MSIIHIERAGMNSSIVFDDDSARIWMEDGIIFFYYKKDIIVDLETQKKNIQNRKILAAGIPRPIFADTTGVKYWTRDAKQYAMTDEANELATSFALLTNSYVTEISINWAFRIFKPKVPARMFKKRDEALKWLGRFKEI